MKKISWLKVASIVLLLNFAGHMLGLLSSAKSPDVREAVASMQSHSFHAGSVVRTFWDFYFGFSLIVGMSLLLMAVLCWQLDSLLKASPERARPMVAVLCMTATGFAAVAWIYIFAVPAMFITVIAACLWTAYFTAN